jgi:hypothetical protein
MKDPGLTDYEQSQFEAIHAKLDRLDEAIRGAAGNGSRPGILVRLDRLEQNAQRQSRLLWLIIGALLTAGASLLTAWVTTGGAGGGMPS